MNNREFERIKLQGTELLRRSVEGSGLKIDEERTKNGRLLLRCSGEHASVLASVLLDSAGWELSLVSNNGIFHKSTLQSRSTSVDELRTLIKRSGLTVTEFKPKNFPEGETVSEMIHKTFGDEKEKDGGITAKQLLRKLLDG